MTQHPRLAPVRVFRVEVNAAVLDLRVIEEFVDRLNGCERRAELPCPRDELLRREPFLRMAISTTEVMDVQMIGDTHAIITSSALGNEFQIVMLREDFWEAWAGDEILYDGSIPAGQFEAWLQKSDDERWATGVAPLKKPEDYEKITEIRVGQDWHIDEIPGME